MHKLTKIFILTALSVISASSIYANYPNSAYGNNQNYHQDQKPYDQGIYDDQSAPDMSGERSFMMQSHNRFNQMRQSGHNMANQDRRMIREGYDPNEMYYDRNNSTHFQSQYDPNNPYRNQEQLMRGNVGYPGSGYHQEGYNQNHEAGKPISYPLNDNYSAPNDYQQSKYYNTPPRYNQGYNHKHQGSYNQNYDYSHPSNEEHSYAPRHDYQPRPSNKQDHADKHSPYHHQKSRESYSYIGDSTDGMSISSSVNQGTLSKDTNANRDIGNDRTPEQSNFSFGSSSFPTDQDSQH